MFRNCNCSMKYGRDVRRAILNQCTGTRTRRQADSQAVYIHAVLFQVDIA
jgi:hypothetical protein